MLPHIDIEPVWVRRLTSWKCDQAGPKTPRQQDTHSNGQNTGSNLPKATCHPVVVCHTFILTGIRHAGPPAEALQRQCPKSRHPAHHPAPCDLATACLSDFHKKAFSDHHILCPSRTGRLYRKALRVGMARGRPGGTRVGGDCEKLEEQKRRRHRRGHKQGTARHSQDTRG